ncbi:hypothetical protein CDIK_0466 [Cucumispora dikerogammari]|nr:hypothetical protein CDIK_0466 [Cucumispora dikerogammari]
MKPSSSLKKDSGSSPEKASEFSLKEDSGFSVEKDSLKHLNFLLNAERLPLKIRLLSKYLFHLQKPKDVILCIFLTCKMLEHRLSFEFLHKYDNNKLDYAKRELAFLKKINFKLDYSLEYLDLYVSLFKLFEDEFKIFYDKNIDLEIGGYFRIKWQEIYKSEKDEKLNTSKSQVGISNNYKKKTEVDVYRNAMIKAPESDNFLLNIFQYLKQKTNIYNFTEKDIQDLHLLFNKANVWNSGERDIFDGFTGKELDHIKEEQLPRFIKFILLVEDLHEKDFVGEFYENEEFPLFVFLSFITERELEIFLLIFDFNVDRCVLSKLRNEFVI